MANSYSRDTIALNCIELFDAMFIHSIVTAINRVVVCEVVCDAEIRLSRQIISEPKNRAEIDKIEPNNIY